MAKKNKNFNHSKDVVGGMHEVGGPRTESIIRDPVEMRPAEPEP